MKKFLSLLLSSVLVISLLSGCSKSSGNDSSNDGSSSGDSSTGEKTVITFMTSGTQATEGEDFETQTLKKMVEAKFPNVTLEVTKLPDDQYYTSLKTKLATGEAPDMIWVQPRNAGANSVYSLAKAGYLTDLSDLNAAKNVPGTGDFTYDGKVYAIPCGVQFLGTYYNKDMFEANGIEVPTDWDSFLAACETLKNAGIQPIVMGDKDAYVMQFGLYQLAANAIYPKNAEFDNLLADGTTKFTDKDTWDKVLSMYSELYEKGYIEEGSLGIGASQAIQQFIDGQAAMTFDGTFNASAIKASGAVDFERGYFPLPGNATGETTYVAGAPGAGPAIYADSKNADLCKQILEYWFDAESDLCKAFQNNPRFITSYDGAPVDPLFTTFIDAYNQYNSFYWCNQAWPAGTENEMEALFGEHIGGQGTTIEQITQGMQNKFEELYTE